MLRVGFCCYELDSLGSLYCLTHKLYHNFGLGFRPITTAADDSHKYFSLFLEKIRLDVSSERK